MHFFFLANLTFTWLMLEYVLAADQKVLAAGQQMRENTYNGRWIFLRLHLDANVGQRDKVGDTSCLTRWQVYYSILALELLLSTETRILPEFSMQIPSR